MAITKEQFDYLWRVDIPQWEIDKLDKEGELTKSYNLQLELAKKYGWK